MFSNSLYIYNAFSLGPTRPRDNQSRFRVCNGLQLQIYGLHKLNQHIEAFQLFTRQAIK